MEHERLSLLQPEQNTSTIPAHHNGHIPLSPDVSPTLPHRYLPDLRAIFTAAKAHFIRTPSSVMVPLPEHLETLQVRIEPVDKPLCEPEQPHPALHSHRRSLPPRPSIPLHSARPRPDLELLSLRGTIEDIATATLIRERFWTHVVRSLANESSTGTPPRDVQLIRRYYMRSANTKRDASWWVQNEDKLS